ncbi:MAG: hydantoinase/oxoprolinase family protein [Pseudomonadota bacterium]
MSVGDDLAPPDLQASISRTMKENVAPSRAYRIGIDVGGTFTKAVLIDNASRAVVGRYSVKTTHAHERGVAAGVVEVFREVLAQSKVEPKEVVFLAHSTTQATNALLEGDVAKVGIIGMAGTAAAKLAEKQANIPALELGAGHYLETSNQFLISDDLSREAVERAIAALTAEGAEVLVASGAFGVDDTASEELVREVGSQTGLLATCGHEITRLYGLSKRTRTAVINASILPKMNETSAMTEASVREAGITAPLMIMRGDGGVMDITEMRRRPALTTLSGPAASVAGALMHLRVSDGIYFEVGGTSTNMGVIRDGRPTVKYANIGGHDTFINSLDVRVVGVAGGSMVRVGNNSEIDVGPRSAHIAGLPYASFASEGELDDIVLAWFEPRPGDGANHATVRAANGQNYALTTTCAANALGLVTPDMHAYGNSDAAKRAFAALGSHLGIGQEEAARLCLEAAAQKLQPVVESLIKEYQLDADQALLIGEGGGAGAIVPFISEQMELKFEISKDAEVISSIGVALAMVRDTVERVIPHPKPEDVQIVRQEAIDAVIRLGADPKAVNVTVEVDPTTQLVSATAIGAAAMHAKDNDGGITEGEARSIAARSMDCAPNAVACVASTAAFRVFQHTSQETPRIRVVDKSGTIRLRRSNAKVAVTTAGQAEFALGKLITDQEARSDRNDYFACHTVHLTDLSHIHDAEQMIALLRSELEDFLPDEAVILIASVQT